MAAKASQLHQVIPEIAEEEPDRADLVELADVHQLVGQEFAIAAAVDVGSQEHEGPDGHAAGARSQEGNLDDADSFGEGSIDQVVGVQLGFLESSHDGGGKESMKVKASADGPCSIR